MIVYTVCLGLFLHTLTFIGTWLSPPTGGWAVHRAGQPQGWGLCWRGGRMTTGLPAGRGAGLKAVCGSSPVRADWAAVACDSPGYAAWVGCGVRPGSISGSGVQQSQGNPSANTALPCGYQTAGLKKTHEGNRWNHIPIQFCSIKRSSNQHIDWRHIIGAITYSLAITQICFNTFQDLYTGHLVVIPTLLFMKEDIW